MRRTLPIPMSQPVGLTTFDAKDPDTSYPPIVPLRPPAGAPNVLVILLDDVGFGASSAFGGPCSDAEPRAAGCRRLEVHALPHHGAVLADALGAADRAQPPLGRDGGDHRVRHLGTGQQLDLAEHGGAARQDPAAERLQHGAVRQVPRGAGVGDQPDGPVPSVADGNGLRVLLRLHRRRDEPVVPGAVRGHDRRRAGPRRRRRATTSTTTCPITPSGGSASRSR